MSDGEWVLAIFEIGSRRRATAAAARGVRAAGDEHIAFERRDWERLLAFAAARSAASEHMRAAKPLRLPDTPDSAPPLSEPPIESSRVPFGARVLLIDDDAGTRDELRAMLVDIGLVVEAVETASDATTRMTERPFDAVILDHHPDGLEPLAFVRQLKRDARWSLVPVLMLSSQTSSRDVVDAFASGADDFLPRPFRGPELGARIFGLLRRARLSPSTAPGRVTPQTSKGGNAR